MTKVREMPSPRWVAGLLGRKRSKGDDLVATLLAAKPERQLYNMPFPFWPFWPCNVEQFAVIDQAKTAVSGAVDGGWLGLGCSGCSGSGWSFMLPLNGPGSEQMAMAGR